MNTKLLKQRILDLAIHGRLVPQKPDDEPASQLLRRISEEKEKLIAQGKIKRPKKSDAVNPAQECPFEIPNSWEWVKLGEICEFLSRGKSPKYSEQRLYPVFAQKCNLKEGGISLEKALFLDPETLPKWSDHYKLRNGDVLINSTGTGTVCRTRLFHESCLGSYPFVVPDSHVSVVRTFESINSNYVYYFISASATQHYLEDNLSGSTNQKELGINVLDNLLIPLPPLAEQQRIVSTIEKWFSLIDEIETNKESLQAAIKQTKSKVLDLAIKGKLVSQDINDEPAKIDSIEITDDIPFELPNNWKWVKLGDISDYGKCQNVNVTDINDNDWVLELEDIEKETSKIIQFKTKAERNIKGIRHAFSQNCVLYSKLRTYLNKVLVPQKNGFCTTEIIPINFLSGINSVYMCYVLKSKYFVDYTMQKCYGVKMPRLSTIDAKNGLIPLPPLSEQTRIVSKIEEVFALLDEIERELA